MELWWDLVPVGVLAAIVLVFFFRPEFLRGSRPELAAPLWASAWATLFASGLLLGIAGGHPLLRAIGRVADSVFPILLLAGAYALTARPIPRWLVPLGGVLVLLETSLSMWLDLRTLNLICSVLEAPLQIGAAWLVWKNPSRRRAGLAERALPFLLAAVAVTELADIEIHRRWGDPKVILAWLVVALATAFVQVLVFAERGRAHGRRLRGHRDFLRRIARPLLEPGGSREALASIVHAIKNEQTYPFFGVWLLSADGSRFEIVDGAALEEIPAFLRVAPTERPILRAVLDAAEPIFLDPTTDPRVSPEARVAGVHHAFLAPLRAGDRTVGVVAGVFSSPPDDDDRALVRDLADEIAVVIANTRLRQTIEERTVELDTQSSRLRATVDSVPVGIVMTEPGGRIALMNRAVAQQLDVPDPTVWVGRSAFDLFASLGARIEKGSRREIDGWIERYAREGASPIDNVEVHLLEPEPKILLLSTEAVHAEDGRHLGRVSVTRDVTRERAIAEHMQHAQRMETVGTLAGGLAHDFNNQLTAILGNARLVLDKLRPDDPACGPLLDLEHSAEHCAELTQGLLAFARQGSASRSAVPTAVAISEVETLLRPSLEPDVRLAIDVAPGTPPVAADAFQLRRVLVNLVTNGRDAVGEHGTVALWARPAPPDAERDGAFVEIGVQDDGSGMDEPTRRRIFDPFFSTKELGRGTGLGLSIVYGIVAAHGGSIVVESAVGRGSTFRVYWPAAEVGSAGTRAPEIAPSSGARTATILVAEDEPSVRRLTRAALERAGHRVIEACDGDEAVERHATHGAEIDLVLLDLSMPRRNGLDALDAMRARQPALRAIVMSGHPDRERTRTWPADVRVLAKPFGPRVLLECVADVLAGDPASR